MPECLNLATDADVKAFLAAGGLVISGPYATAAECAANCGTTSSSSASPTGSITSHASIGMVTSPCCGSTPIPTVLHVTFDGVLAFLGSVALTYDAGSQTWVGTASGCGGTITFTFSCNISPQFLLEAAGAAAAFWGFGGGVATCSPFSWGPFAGVVSGGCSGASNATVTI